MMTYSMYSNEGGQALNPEVSQWLLDVTSPQRDNLIGIIYFFAQCMKVWCARIKLWMGPSK